jgi:hypothetical protein
MSSLHSFEGMNLGKKVPLQNKTKVFSKGVYTVYKEPTTFGFDLFVINKSGIVDIEMILQKQGVMYYVDAVVSISKTYKAHELYRDLLVKGVVPGLIAGEQSEGGRAVWNKLSKFKDIEVFGWDPFHNSAVNLGSSLPDDSETHVSVHDNTHDPDTNQIRRMQLVAIKKP